MLEALLLPSVVDGGKPRRERLVTWYPSSTARLQIVCPRKPVPPKIRSFPFFSFVSPVVVSAAEDLDERRREDGTNDVDREVKEREKRGRWIIIVARKVIVFIVSWCLGPG